MKNIMKNVENKFPDAKSMVWPAHTSQDSCCCNSCYCAWSVQ